MGGNDTTVTTMTLAGSAAVIALWVMGYYQPDLMASAPAGLEGAIIVLFSAVIGWVKS